MNMHETRRYTMFGRVETFGKANAAAFAPRSPAGRRFARMARIIQDIDAAKAGQKRGRATVKNVRFNTLRILLRNVARTARAIAREEPGFANKFRVPISSGHIRLLTAADAMLIELRKPGLADKLIAHELPAAFIEQIARHRQALAEAHQAKQRADSKGITKTAAVGRLVRAGMTEVAHLDAIVRNKFTDNPEQLRAWQSARTLERAPRRKPTARRATAGIAPAST